MNLKVKYGMLGLGGFGRYRRMRLRQSGAFELVAGVDISDTAFEQARQEDNPALKRYGSVEELVADPEVEAVVISTPAALHVPQAMIAARAGKAIYCEKPLGHDLEACRELVEYCETHRVPHGHGFSARYSDLWQEVKRIVQSGKLGQIVSVSASSMHTGGLKHSSDNWRFTPEHNPGGPLFQCGIHKIDTLRSIFGEGRWLSGIVNRRITGSATDDAYVLLGAFGGIPTTLHSHYVASYRHAMEIYGTAGDLFVSEHPTRLEYKATNLDSPVEPVEDITATIPKGDKIHEALLDFAAAVRERRQPVMSGREGLRTLELVFAATEVATDIDTLCQETAPA